MAQIITKNLSKLEKGSQTVHNIVDATYSVFRKDGNEYFQIDTYGAPGRKMPGKTSQSIQLDRTNLVELMRKAAKEMKITKDEIFK